ASMIKEAGHEVAEHAVVEDDPKKIRKQVKRWIKDPEVDVVITTGGTGFTGRDVPPGGGHPKALTFSACPGRRVLARMPGTASSSINWTTATVHAPSSRSCRGC